MTTTNSTKSSKAIKAGRLAISAEALGNESEAAQAATTCGRLARAAGLDLEAIHAALKPDISRAELTWHYMVDGWYEAA